MTDSIGIDDRSDALSAPEKELRELPGPDDPFRAAKLLLDEQFMWHRQFDAPKLAGRSI